MKNRYHYHPARLALVFAAVLGVIGPATAARKATLPVRPVPPVRFADYHLENGMRVLLARDTSAPVVAVCVTFNVGSWVEPPGRTGFAHLFEHMMFQGSKNAPKGVFDRVIVNSGGDDNGTTSQDRTNFFEVVPANWLEPVLYIHADTVANLEVDQANLDNQRAVVQEERRLNYDNKPYGLLFETLYDNFYANFAYRHDTIGSMKDLDAATLEDVQRFFRTYYGPNNAVLSIVGDFDETRARALVQKYFGAIPRGPQPTFPSLVEPPHTEERRVTFKDPLAPLPAYLAGYHIPYGASRDYPALEALAWVLASGKSSRLYQSLVERKRLANDVGASAESMRGPGLFYIQIDFSPGQ